jgi:hypothetical protein
VWLYHDLAVVKRSGSAGYDNPGETSALAKHPRVTRKRGRFRSCTVLVYHIYTRPTAYQPLVSVGVLLPTSVMSTTSQAVIPPSTFLSIFNAAWDEYRKKTGKDLQTHPFAGQLNSCDTPDTILAVLQPHVDALSQAQKNSQALMKWLNPIVHVLFIFSATLCEGVGLVWLTAWVVSLLPFSITQSPDIFSCKSDIFGNRRASPGDCIP